VRALELPTATGAEPREVRVLLEQPGLKLAAIALRAGTVLPPHDAPVAVTIVAVSGSGTLVSGAERLRLDPGHAVALAPGVPHAVEPDPGSDLVILVHHLGSDAGHAAHAAHAAHATHEAHP
jgi:quercetin dioxygenase-like cupin family protein